MAQVQPGTRLSYRRPIGSVVNKYFTLFTSDNFARERFYYDTSTGWGTYVYAGRMDPDDDFVGFGVVVANLATDFPTVVGDENFLSGHEFGA